MYVHGDTKVKSMQTCQYSQCKPV